MALVKCGPRSICQSTGGSGTRAARISARPMARPPPVRNPVYRPVQVLDRFARTRGGLALGRLLMRLARVPLPPVMWAVDRGPHFTNAIGALELEGQSSLFRLERTVPGDGEPLETVLEQRLA